LPPFGGQFPLLGPDLLSVVDGIFGAQFFVFAIFSPLFDLNNCFF